MTHNHDFGDWVYSSDVQVCRVCGALKSESDEVNYTCPRCGRLLKTYAWCECGEINPKEHICWTDDTICVDCGKEN